jgi:hypothetical protein
MAEETTSASGPTGDELIGQSEQAEMESGRASRAVNLFDVRRMIGGLFVIYGVILTIMGITASQKEIDKAAGINLNLWVGIGMLIVGALFLAWAFGRPLVKETDEDDEPPEGDRTVRGAHAPVGADAAALSGSKTTSRRTRSDREGTTGSRRAGGQEP